MSYKQPTEENSNATQVAFGRSNFHGLESSDDSRAIHSSSVATSVTFPNQDVAMTGDSGLAVTPIAIASKVGYNVDVLCSSLLPCESSD